MNLAEITSRYVGAPFKLGGQSFDEGYDCFSLVYLLARDLGKDPPAEFGDLTLGNYAALYDENEDAAIDAMLDFAETHLTEVPPGKAFVGDLLIMRDNIGRSFAALHAGNNYVISSFINVGVSIAKLRTFKLDKVFKWAADS